MSDTEKKYTAREYVMGQRAAFAHGWHSACRSGTSPYGDGRKAYPLPKITRPRVVRDHAGIAWRVVKGFIERKSSESSEWDKSITCYGVTSDRVRILADLLANPTEEIEVDE